MLGTLSLPFYVYSVGEFNQHWKAAKHDFDHLAFALFFRGLDTLCVICPYLSATFISCERLYTVYWPFKHRSLSTRTYSIAFFVLWTCAVRLRTILILLSFLSSFGCAVHVTFSVLVSLTVIICVYDIAIWKTFQPGGDTSQKQEIALRWKRFTKTLLMFCIHAGLTKLASLNYLGLFNLYI